MNPGQESSMPWKPAVKQLLVNLSPWRMQIPFTLPTTWNYAKNFLPMALPEFDRPHALRSRVRRRYFIVLSKLFTKHTFTGGYGQIFRTQALRQAGGFSEKIWPYVLLDHEIMYRIFKQGVGDPNPFTVSQMPFFRYVISKGVAPPTYSRSARRRSFGGFISIVCRKNKVSRGIFKQK